MEALSEKTALRGGYLSLCSGAREIQIRQQEAERRKRPAVICPPSFHDHRGSAMTVASHAPKAMTALEWGMLIALSLLWGGSFFCNGVAVKELPVLTVVVGRVALAAVMLLTALWLLGIGLSLRPERWAAFFVMGLLNNVIPFSLIVWGQSHITSGHAAILNAATPLFTVVAAHAVTADERMTGGRLFGVLAGIAGVIIMIGGAALQSLGAEVAAQLACLGGALSYALAGLYGRRFKALGVTPIQTATGQVAASSLILVPMMLIVDKPWRLPMPTAETIAALISAAALCTALAYILYFRILATAGATNLLLVTFLIPVSAILLGIAFLGERLEPKHVWGIALIGCGLAAIDGRPVRMLRAAAARLGEPRQPHHHP
jgi:drug/metabolite transporter (DMT)-like permease